MTGHGGRKREGGLQRMVRERIREYVRTHCDDNQTEFARRANIPRTTVTGWLAKGEPHTPDVPQLVDLANKLNMSLNWLLIGELPMLRGAPHPEEQLPQRLRAAMVAQLSSEIGDAEEVKQLLEVILPPPDEIMTMMVKECQKWVRAAAFSRMVIFPGLLHEPLAKLAGLSKLPPILWGSLNQRTTEGDDDRGG